MIATQANLLKFSQGPKQFIIPIYQRTYSWTKKECTQLWNDLVRVAGDKEIPAHFIGSIVYIESGIYQAAGVPQLLVIDGQQRLTTISLLLYVLGEAIENAGQKTGITRRKINNRFLFNSDEDGELRYKLILTRQDKDTFIHLIDKPTSLDSGSQRIIENYRFFQKKIRESKLSPVELYTGLTKFVIVDVSLDRNYDNPQLIFESLNSTGLDLSQADLIRNFILMGLEPKEQETLYTNYWLPMEESFGQAHYTRLFDRFMRDYLTIKNDGTIPNLKAVYAEFKSYVYSQEDGNIADVVADIHRYSAYFVNLAFARTDDPNIRQVLQDINILKVDVAYPFFMEVYDDHKQGLLNQEEFITILKIVESYVFRRAICGIPTNSLNKTFATLSRSIDKTNYLESVEATFLVKDSYRRSYRRFPPNEEFKQELMVKDVYNFRNRNYLLRKLENYRRKERVGIDDYTIEHILPQNENLSPSWQNELGENWQEIQARYLHTIGNLTLTGYNSELSDSPFLKKRNMAGGFADSPLRLNHSLAKLNTWNETEIKKRASILAELAVKVWPMPTLSPDILAKYKQPKVKRGERIYTLSDYRHPPVGELFTLYQLLRKRILNLDSSVAEEFKKLYIAYKTTTNFVDVVPQKRRFRLSLNMAFDEIDDPKGICRDITNIGRWGNGDVEIGIDSVEQLDYTMFLIRQSFEKHSEEFNE